MTVMEHSHRSFVNKRANTKSSRCRNVLSNLNYFFPVKVLAPCHFTKINFYIPINGARSQLSLRIIEQDNVKIRLVSRLITGNTIVTQEHAQSGHSCLGPSYLFPHIHLKCLMQNVSLIDICYEGWLSSGQTSCKSE